MIFRTLLLIAPREFRREYRALIWRDLSKSIAEEESLGGPFASFCLFLRACADAVVSGFGERFAMIGRDIVFALRSLRKTPVFTLVIIVTLALAIGANAAVFSVLRAVVLAPLPYVEPQNLVAISNSENGGGYDAMSLPNALDLRAQNHVFTDVSVAVNVDATITGSGKPRALSGIDTTWPAFDILGVRPQLGRFFNAGDEPIGSGEPIIISDRLWRGMFGADARIIGRAVTLDAQAYRIIGVAPPRFRFPMPWHGLLVTDFWTLLRPHDDPFRGDIQFSVIARLRPGASIAAADADVTRIAAGLARRYPKEDTGKGARVVSFADVFLGSVRQLLIAAFGAVAGVVLIACANVANLLLSRSASRDRDLAIRMAVGATRRRIVTQILMETLLFASVSGAIGVLLAAALIHCLVALNPSSIPRLDDIRIDVGVVAYTFGIVGLCALASGIVPALALSRPRLADALKAAGRGGDASRGMRARNAFVVLEIAISVALVVTSGLIVRSFVILANTPLGITIGDVRIAPFALPQSARYGSAARIDTFDRESAARVRAIPGVRFAAWAVGSVPLVGGSNTGVKIEGHPRPIGQDYSIAVSDIGPEYFSALDIPLKSGRAFTDADRLGNAPVAIVDEKFALTYFNGSALGHWIIPGRGVKKPYPRYTIVGIVGNVRNTFDGAYNPNLYLPLAQIPDSNASLLVRVRPGVDITDAEINAAIIRSDPLLPSPTVLPLRAYADDALAQTKLSALLLGSLALVALFLAVAGVYAVVSFGVEQRTHEFGIRMALGAREDAIVRSVVVRAARLALVGILGGVILAGFAAGFVRDELFGIGTFDPITYAIVIVLVAVTALLAALIPALRATRVDPVVALRQL